MTNSEFGPLSKPKFLNQNHGLVAEHPKFFQTMVLISSQNLGFRKIHFFLLFLLCGPHPLSAIDPFSLCGPLTIKKTILTTIPKHSYFIKITFFSKIYSLKSLFSFFL